MKNDNIIQFPPQRSKNPVPLNNAEITSSVNMIKHNHINESLATIVPLLFTNIELAGFMLDVGDEGEDDVNIKNSALIVESIRSLLCKLHEIDHPFISLADTIFVEQEDGYLELIDKLDMTFKEDALMESDPE